MSEWSPISSAELPETASELVTLSDLSNVPKWRTFSGYPNVRPGTSRNDGEHLVWSVSPGEWTVVGPRPVGPDVVDLTHVRVMFQLTGEEATRLLAKVCGLDLDDQMFPNGAAGRTLVAGVATELVRHDQNGVRSFLILPSRSFSRYMHQVLIDAGHEFGLA